MKKSLGGSGFGRVHGGACVDKHDPQEDDPKLGPIIRQAGETAREEVLCGKEMQLGDCHEIWKRQKEILKAQGIDWMTPKEMNPNRMYD